MTEAPNKTTNFQDGYIVRNRIKRNRFYADNEFLESGYAALLGRRAAVYYCLLKHANSETQICWPSYEIMMKETGIKSKNEIASTLNALEYLKLVAVRPPPLRKSNTYYILAHTQWRELTSTTRNTAKAVLKLPRMEYLKGRKDSMPLNTLSQRSNSTYKIKGNNNLPNDGTNKEVKEKTPEEQKKANKTMAEIRKWGQENLGWEDK